MENNKKEVVVEEPVVISKKSTSGSEPSYPDNYVSYTDTVTSASMMYPEEWGTPVAEQITGFSDTGYTDEVPYYVKITFADQDNLEFRLFNGRAFEGGRGYESPLASAMAFDSFLHYFSYKFDSAGDDHEIFRFSNVDVADDLGSDPLEDPKYSTYVADDTDGKVLIINTNFTLSNLGLLPWVTDEFSGSQADAEDQLVTLNRKTRFVGNISNEHILGVSADYAWNDIGADTVLVTDITRVLSSLN